MHVPPGGYQSQGKGKALWDDPGAQERFTNLWRAIAERYRGEPTIAGYDLLNEAVVTRSPKQWHDLAARVISAVREVDPEHMIFIERVNAIAGDWSEDNNRNFFRVEDPNIVYESRVPVCARDKEFLAHELDAYVAWGKKNQVPLYLGEFGAIRYSFPEDRGGIRWVEDMLDLLLERRLHFAYHEEHFGLFYGDGSLPDPKHANTELMELFRRKLPR